MFDAVFDLDGTIVDSVTQCAAIVEAMRRDRGDGSPVDLVSARACSSVGGARMVAKLLGEFALETECDLAEFRARYLETPTPVETLYPGARRALEELAACGVRLSICSAKPQVLCEKVVHEVGLSNLFAAIVGSASDRPCKPDPAHLFDMLATLGRSAAVCYIGDSEVDHALATAAGIPLVLVEHGYAAEGYNFGATVRAASFQEIPSLVMRALLDGGGATTIN
jgi:phosphoglycolate phosphatase